MALSCPNLPAFPIVYYGALKSGATIVPLNVLLTEREIAYHLEDSGAVAYFCFEGTPELAMGKAGQQHSTRCRGARKQTDVTSTLFRLASDDGTGYLPDFLLITVPRVFLGGGTGRFANKETRYDAAAAKKQGDNAYAHTAVRYTVIPTREDADTDLIGKAAAILTNQAVAWDGRQTEPTPLRLARQIDTDHPYYRRTLPEEPDEESSAGTTTETD